MTEPDPRDPCASCGHMLRDHQGFTHEGTDSACLYCGCSEWMPKR